MKKILPGKGLYELTCWFDCLNREQSTVANIRCIIHMKSTVRRVPRCQVFEDSALQAQKGTSVSSNLFSKYGPGIPGNVYGPLKDMQVKIIL